jgi:hypothetical protein
VSRDPAAGPLFNPIKFRAFVQNVQWIEQKLNIDFG